ncbi:hypothetical protein IQ06DRAFT_300736 [Phaeosphaeriaceae sp. SRC1lsM3a]|nr:hypothetical protein IQ06DRAFT_300736 [Stagonospora sp. SRC1lsM3a]
MPCYPISSKTLDTVAATHDPTAPVTMLNLWRYRSSAQYAPEHAHLSPAPCTGEEALLRYRAAIVRVIPRGCSVKFMGKPLGNVAAPEGEEKWDAVVLVEYPNLQGFRDMVECKEYVEEIAPHREAGLEEWRLIVNEAVEV